MKQPKMRIYMPSSLDDYELCHPVEHDDFETINVQINGQLRQAIWQPLRMRLIRKDDGRELLPSDSPWLGEHALIFRANAMNALGPLLREHGELLPLLCEGAELWIFNPTRVLDALDEDASSVLRFSSGRIMDIERYVFRPDVIRSVHAFKIPSLRVSPTYVSQHFVETWESAGLRGLEFEQVWAE